MSGDAAKAYATEQSAALAKQAHSLTLELYKHVVSHEHSYGEWVTTTAPTCKAEGEATQTCKFCDATQTKVLAKGCQATKTETIPLVVKAPATGDNSHMVMMAAAMMLSVTGAAWMLKKKIWVK